MRVIAIEEHWTTPASDRALRARPERIRDESVVLSDRGDIPTRPLDIGGRRVEPMDAARSGADPAAQRLQKRS